MSKDLTDKRYCIVIRGGYRMWIDEKQFENLIHKLNEGQDQFLLTGSGVVNRSDISLVVPASDLEREERVKKGDWKCRYGHWHTKGQQCGHVDY